MRRHRQAVSLVGMTTELVGSLEPSAVTTSPDVAQQADGPASEAHRPRRVRVLLGYGVIAAVVPYLALKASWLAGVMIGVPEGSAAREGEFAAANIVTALLDVAAVGLALALTHRWGRRVPAWWVVVPSWVGIGLLMPAVVKVVNGATAAALTGGEAVTLSGGLVEPWVYVVVYTCFTVQGLLLTAAFWLYARDRWGDRVGAGRRACSRPAQPTRELQVVLGYGGALVAGGIAAAHLLMASGTEGAFGAYETGWEYTARSGQVIDAVAALLAATGVLALLRRQPTWTAAAAAWTGTGAMFAYALLVLLAVVADAPGSQDVTALNGVTQLGALLAGSAMAVAALLNLADGHQVADRGVDVGGPSPGAAP
jgi:hypothetical protein